MRQIALDTETTGLEIEKGHRLIEIGGVEMIDRQITGKTFHQYLNPNRKIDADALKVHGINENFLADKPLFVNIVDRFLAFIRDSELIIHHAAFDVGFLENELQLAFVNPWAIKHYCNVIDTLKIAKRLHPGRRNNLDILCKRYKINSQHRQWHGALIDAELLAKVYLAMTSGQGSLFGDDIIDFPNVNVDVLKYRPTIIYYANQKELKQHTMMMKMIKRGIDNES